MEPFTLLGSRRMSKLHNSCVALIPLRMCLGGHRFVTVKSNRGIILPGGKREGTESLTDCLIREVKEETGLTVERKLMFLLESREYGNYNVNLFLCTVKEPINLAYEDFEHPYSSKEGELYCGTREELLESDYSDFYSRMFRTYDSLLDKLRP